MAAGTRNLTAIRTLVLNRTPASRPRMASARQHHPQTPMGLTQALPVRRDMQTRSTSTTGSSVLKVQASSRSQTLAIPLRRSVDTGTVRETVDRKKRKQLTCLHPGTQLIMSRAIPGQSTLLTLRTTYWCDGATLTPRDTHRPHPEEPRSCAASRRMGRGRHRGLHGSRRAKTRSSP